MPILEGYGVDIVVIFTRCGAPRTLPPLPAATSGQPNPNATDDDNWRIITRLLLSDIQPSGAMARGLQARAHAGASLPQLSLARSSSRGTPKFECHQAMEDAIETPTCYGAGSAAVPHHRSTNIASRRVVN